MAVHRGPFALGVVLGWLIVRRTAAAIWAITAITGLVIWVFRNQSVPHWSFVIVATVMGALLMLGWRAVARKLRLDSFRMICLRLIRSSLLFGEYLPYWPDSSRLTPCVSYTYSIR